MQKSTGPKDHNAFCEAFCQLVVDLVIFSSISIPVPFQGESLESSHGNASLSEFPHQSEMDRNGGLQQQSKQQEHNSTTDSHCASPELALVYPEPTIVSLSDSKQAYNRRL
jgi:hypothetical protein